jgi:hypothetical protein
MELCLPKLMAMDRQTLLYSTQALQSSSMGTVALQAKFDRIAKASQQLGAQALTDEDGLRVLMGLLKYARSAGRSNVLNVDYVGLLDGV